LWQLQRVGVLDRDLRVTARGAIAGAFLGPEGLALAVALVPAVMAVALSVQLSALLVVVAGLTAFALVFALNSAVHSYLIVHAAQREAVSVDVGFYYMANAIGRLLGTLLSGALFAAYGQGVAGLIACLVASALLLLAAAGCSIRLPKVA
jgi:predicted MFS family arabinose efflux permease